MMLLALYGLAVKALSTSQAYVFLPHKVRTPSEMAKAEDGMWTDAKMSCFSFPSNEAVLDNFEEDADEDL